MNRAGTLHEVADTASHLPIAGAVTEPAHELFRLRRYEEKSPFPREVVLAHLARSLDELTKLHADRRRANEDELSEAFARATALLAEVRDDYASAATPDARKLEESLTGVDGMLDEAIRVAATDSKLEAIEAEIDTQLKPYKRHMDKAAFEQTRDNLRRKRLREDFRVPRLSLFYLSL